MTTPSFNLYKGSGQKLSEALPPYSPLTGEEKPELYLASPGLQDAVNVALALGQPLLVTGEPGTGKTKLAAAVAWELGLEIFEFHTKTTSSAEDLFYHYDALRRFHDVQINDLKPVSHYITCQALGLAIILSNPAEKSRELLPEDLKDKDPCRSVVLIDEIDKAPRDLPNDMLNEIEAMQFRIKETTWKAFEADSALRPVVVMTSNSEKNLPDAFLRRCIFFHIDFPEMNDLKKIVMRRFNSEQTSAPMLDESFVDKALTHFYRLRKLGLKKNPSTAELLAWLSVLKTLNPNIGEPREEDRQRIIMSYSVLAKNREDLERMKRHLDEF